MRCGAKLHPCGACRSFPPHAAPVLHTEGAAFVGELPQGGGDRILLALGGDAAILYCFVFLLIAAAGPGPWSVDASMRRKHVAVTEDATGEPVP